MSPNPTLVRRLLWTAAPVLALGLVLARLIGPGQDGGGSESDLPRATAAPSASSPGSAPSSGPTGTPPPGSLEEVPVEEVTPEPAIPLTATADLGKGLALRVARVESVEGVARGAGEIAGPALRLTLELSNDSDEEVSIDSAVVDLLVGQDRTPAGTLTGPGSRAFEGSVQPDDSVTGVYVFGVPPEARKRVQVSVSYQSGAPVVVFVGDVA